MSFANAQRNPAVRSGEEYKAKATYAAAQSTAVQVKAAPTNAEQSLYIEGVLVSTDTAGWVQIVSDTGGTPTEVIPKIYLAANASGQLLFLDRKVKVAAGKNLGVITNITGNHGVMFTGYTA
jgi:hypothetical protein